jgi:hypothetical protein
VRPHQNFYPPCIWLHLLASGRIWYLVVGRVDGMYAYVLLTMRLETRGAQTGGTKVLSHVTAFAFAFGLPFTPCPFFTACFLCGHLSLSVDLHTLVLSQCDDNKFQYEILPLILCAGCGEWMDRPVRCSAAAVESRYLRDPRWTDTCSNCNLLFEQCLANSRLGICYSSSYN